PVLGGLDVLREIRSRWPALPVVVLTGVREAGPAELEAVSRGAQRWLTKLPHEGNMVNAIGWVRERLAPCLRQVIAQRAAPAAVAAEVRRPAAPAAPPAMPVRAARRPSFPDLLAIGTSTGGPDALDALLRELPADFPLPILIVQHMPKEFTGLLAQRLTQRTPFVAAEGRAGAPLLPGQVWIAPGNRHMLVQRNGNDLQLQLSDAAPENSFRPSVDVLFRSLARLSGVRTLAVVLTGMGQDGLEGGRLIVAAGGDVLAQDEASSVVWGMPGAVVRANLASAVVPLSAMADTIMQRTRGSRALLSQTL
ncbi:MAG: chemotaxis protein CheB, partial [Gemmatimonadota bacterium]|nr:chemotaxis protein CheB [Gemmatimonadota bacterium]